MGGGTQKSLDSGGGGYFTNKCNAATATHSSHFVEVWLVPFVGESLKGDEKLKFAPAVAAKPFSTVAAAPPVGERAEAWPCEMVLAICN